MACEIITAEQLAERLHVSRRLVLDWTRDKNDPLPHFRRGRIKLFRWLDDCPDSALKAWFERQECCERAGNIGRGSYSSRQ
jgi:hypothetical protein